MLLMNYYERYVFSVIRQRNEDLYFLCCSNTVVYMYYILIAGVALAIVVLLMVIVFYELVATKVLLCTRVKAIYVE